jgi:hypothetical protein
MAQEYQCNATNKQQDEQGTLLTSGMEVLDLA